MSIIFFVSLLTLHCASALTSTDQDCIRTYNGTLNNDFLLGEWFRLYYFTYWGNLPSSVSCRFINFAKPTEDELQEYRDYYTDDTKPYDLEHNAILYEDVQIQQSGLVTGHDEVKFYLLPHDTHWGRPQHGYQAQMYRRIDDQHVLWMNCDLRGTDMWLLGRDKEAPVEQLQALISGMEEVKGMSAQRFCSQG